MFDFRTHGKSLWSKYNAPAKKKAPIEKIPVETDKEYYFDETIFDFIKRDRDEAKRMLESICEEKKIDIAKGFSIRAIDQFLDMPGLYSDMAGKIPDYDLAGMLSVLYDWLKHSLVEIETHTKNLEEIAMKTGNPDISENLKWLIFWAGHAYFSSASFRDEILKAYSRMIELKIASEKAGLKGRKKAGQNAQKDYAFLSSCLNQMKAEKPNLNKEQLLEIALKDKAIKKKLIKKDRKLSTISKKVKY